MYNGIFEVTFNEPYADQKNLLSLKLTKASLNFSLNTTSSKPKNLIWKAYGKSKAGITPTIPFPDNATYI